MENKIGRRDFLKKLAGGGALALGASVAGCVPSVRKAARTTERGGEMEYRVNPGNGDRVSLLGYGCMRWKMIKDENGNDIIDQEYLNELVDHAMAHGVNYFDTSPAYLQGQSETATGIALSRYPRSRYYLATKLSNMKNPSRDVSMKMYYQSFTDMQTEYFDYYLLHNIGRGGYPVFAQRCVDNGMIDFLLKERERGKIRQLGFSFHGNREGFDAMLGLHEKYRWDFVQIEMNYMDWQHADGVKNVNADYLYDEIDKLGLPIVVMEPLLGGRLAKVPDNVANLMKERDPEASLASWAFRFVGSHPRILTALSGMTYMSDLEDNLNTFTDFQYMTDDEIAFVLRMADLMSEYPTVNCTGCKYCMPCPYGINIPEIFRHYNTCVNEGLIAQSKEQEGYKKLRKAYLTTYNKAVPALRQADHCIGCGQCLDECPQSIDIPVQLHRIDHYIEKLKQNTL